MYVSFSMFTYVYLSMFMYVYLSMFMYVSFSMFTYVLFIHQVFSLHGPLRPWMKCYFVSVQMQYVKIYSDNYDILHFNILNNVVFCVLVDISNKCFHSVMPLRM